MDTKKLGAALLTGVLAASMLAGCGSDKKDAANDTKKPLRVATNATFVPLNSRITTNRRNIRALKWT